MVFRVSTPSSRSLSFSRNPLPYVEGAILYPQPNTSATCATTALIASPVHHRPQLQPPPIPSLPSPDVLARHGEKSIAARARPPPSSRSARSLSSRLSVTATVACLPLSDIRWSPRRSLSLSLSLSPLSLLARSRRFLKPSQSPSRKSEFSLPFLHSPSPLLALSSARERRRALVLGCHVV